MNKYYCYLILFKIQVDAINSEFGKKFFKIRFWKPYADNSVVVKNIFWKK